MFANFNLHSQSPLAICSLFTPPPPQPRSDPAPHPPRAAPSTSRGPRIRPNQWDPHKDRIKRLYMEEDKSLEETMYMMEDEFSFTATKKQYNTKLKGWGFIKNIPASTASWMVNKAKTRKRQGLDTEFTVGGQPWTMDRIERSAKRAKADGNEAESIDPSTPPDVSYTTPIKKPTDADVYTVDNEGFKLPVKWTPRKRGAEVNSGLMRLQVDGRSLLDLHNLLQRAQNQASVGNFQGSEESYLEALRGYEVLLSPTHETTKSTAYDLADLYALTGRMADADKVLDWMSDMHIERFGVGHKSTRTHLISVADMLHRWSRPDEAVLMIYRAAEMFEDSSNQQMPQAEVPDAEEAMRDELNLPRINGRTLAILGDDDPIRMDYQIQHAIAQASADQAGAETLLIQLLEQCEKHPGRLAVPILEARTALISFYKAHHQNNQFHSAMSHVDRTFSMVFDSDTQKTELLFSRAIEMIGLLLKAERYAEAEPLFNRVQFEAAKLLGEHSAGTISVLIRIGTLLQDAGQWIVAKPRFEQALAASMEEYGLHNLMTARLEQTLEERRFPTSVPSTQEIKRVSEMATEHNCRPCFPSRYRDVGQLFGYESTIGFLDAIFAET